MIGLCCLIFICVLFKVGAVDYKIASASKEKERRFNMLKNKYKKK